jgi:hypothetical protein
MKYKMCFDFYLLILSQTFTILRTVQGSVATNVHWSSRKETVILVKFETILILWTDIRKKSSIIKFHQNLSVGAEFLHADRRNYEQK